MGYRTNRHLAGYLRWQLIQVRGDVHLLPDVGETLAEYFSDIKRHDLLVVIGFRRRVPEIRQVLNWAQASDVPSLFVTDPTARSDTNATWTIRCETRGEDAFDRYTGAMSFFHFLSMAAVAKSGPKGRRRLAKIEELHEEFKEYV